MLQLLDINLFVCYSCVAPTPPFNWNKGVLDDIMTVIRVQALFESQGGRPGLPIPDNPYGLFGCKATLN